MSNIYGDCHYLLCAIESYNKPQQQRLELMNSLLEGSLEQPENVLAYEDMVIEEFNRKVHQHYHIYMQLSADIKSYDRLLKASMLKQYPWVSEGAYSSMYGRFSYR